MHIFLEAACMVFLIQCIAFGLSIWTDKNSIADVFWGGTIALTAAWTIGPLLIMALEYNPSNTPYISSLVVGFATILWGTRLCLHIGKRFVNKKEEDKRYAKMAANWQRFYFRSFWQVFMLQGLLMLAMLTPVLSATYIAPETNFYFWGLGIVVFMLGFIFEVIADLQLSRFVKSKKPGEIMRSGLWKYSRHPNYFGEVVLWWGIWLITLPSELWYISLIAPLTITFLILGVSGVPMAEAHYADNKEFQDYAKKTSIFFPWWPKS